MDSTYTFRWKDKRDKEILSTCLVSVVNPKDVSIYKGKGNQWLIELTPDQYKLISERLRKMRKAWEEEVKLLERLKDGQWRIFVADHLTKLSPAEVASDEQA